jgi:hypothetical protein
MKSSTLFEMKNLQTWIILPFLLFTVAKKSISDGQMKFDYTIF